MNVVCFFLKKKRLAYHGCDLRFGDYEETEEMEKKKGITGISKRWLVNKVRKTNNCRRGIWAKMNQSMVGYLLRENSVIRALGDLGTWRTLGTFEHTLLFVFSLSRITGISKGS